MTYKSKGCFVLVFLCFSFCFTFCQNKKLVDSLIIEYYSGSYEEDELDILTKIVSEETNPDKQLEFSELLISKASIDSSFSYLYTGYLQKGNSHYYKGNNAEALNSYFKSLKYANRTNDERGIASLMISIADTYNVMDNSNNAEIYYNKGIRQLRKINDSVKIATALLNAGDYYFNSGKLDSSLAYTKESEIIFLKINHPIGQAYSLGNKGMIYAQQNKDILAEQSINAAITILEELQDYYPISVYFTYMSDIYMRNNNFQLALNYAKRSLDLATTYGLKEQISEANLKLSELHDMQGDQILSYKYYKEHIVYRDSVKNLKSVQEMANLRTDYEVSQNQIKADYEISQKQIEVNLLNEQKKSQRIAVIAISIALILIGIVAFGLFRRNKFIQRTKRIIEEEKERSDKLLLNILPRETAQELKEKGKVKAKKHDSVSVLFSDFKGFTSYSENLSPEDLVETVDFYFSKFDQIIERHGLEKIKTIGDAYMCVGGLENSKENHAQNAVNAAFEIASFVEKTKNDMSASGLTFDIRIGINSGPVVAGVVGTKKFAYDIWGDTVNIASRMESASEPGKVNISDTTFKKIKDKWTCEYRGEIQVKNKGAMKMYFVNSH